MVTKQLNDKARVQYIAGKLKFSQDYITFPMSKSSTLIDYFGAKCQKLEKNKLLHANYQLKKPPPKKNKPKSKYKTLEPIGKFDTSDSLNLLKPDDQDPFRPRSANSSTSKQ